MAVCSSDGLQLAWNRLHRRERRSTADASGFRPASDAGLRGQKAFEPWLVPYRTTFGAKPLSQIAVAARVIAPSSLSSSRGTAAPTYDVASPRRTGRGS